MPALLAALLLAGGGARAQAPGAAPQAPVSKLMEPMRRPDWEGARRDCERLIARLARRFSDARDPKQIEAMALLDRAQADAYAIERDVLATLQSELAFFQRNPIAFASFRELQDLAESVFAAKVYMVYANMLPRALGERFAGSKLLEDEPVQGFPPAPAISQEQYEAQYLPYVKELNGVICQRKPDFAPLRADGQPILKFCLSQ